MADFQPHVVVVDFNHARGPEIEFWVRDDGPALYAENDWSLLPFMALSDGAHAMVEDFSYFTLLKKGGSSSAGDHEKSDDGPAKSQPNQPDSTLFGIACTRQIKADRLKRRSTSVTRSTVQKAVCVITGTAQGLRQMRERLGAVTGAWFAQEDFYDTAILKDFQETLSQTYKTDLNNQGFDLGLSLREIIYEFRHQTLVIVKCMLLQRKMLFFGSKCERLCMIQFALISLIPGLIRNLQDSASPSLDQYAQTVTRPSSLRTSHRESLLAYMGLPLNIFGKGSFFGPYTPLQQLDILADYDTKSYMVGSTNSLLLHQKERYADLLVNLDESNSIMVNSPSLRQALYLSAADRRWIDQLTAVVIETWDPENPSRPKTHGYAGSEDSIRLQFEEYLLALLSSAAYKVHVESVTQIKRQPSPNPTGVPSTHTSSTLGTSHHTDPTDTSHDFGASFLTMWQTTNNYALFLKLTHGNHIFDIIEPRHPTSGALGVEDVQRRLQQTMADLKVDEKVREGRETLNKTFATGKEKVNAGITRLWAEWEGRRAPRDKIMERAGPDTTMERRRDSQSSTATRGSMFQGSTDGSAPVDEVLATTSPPSTAAAAVNFTPVAGDTSGISAAESHALAVSAALKEADSSTPSRFPLDPLPPSTASTQNLPTPLPSTPRIGSDQPQSSPPGSASGATSTKTTPTASRAIPISALRNRTANIRSNIANNLGHSHPQQTSQPSTPSGTATNMNPYSTEPTSPPRTATQPPNPTNTQFSTLSSSPSNRRSLTITPGGGGNRTVSNPNPSLFTIPQPSNQNQPPSSNTPNTISGLDTAQIQQSARENAAKAGAYLSSWGSWAREKAVAAAAATSGHVGNPTSQKAGDEGGNPGKDMNTGVGTPVTSPNLGANLSSGTTPSSNAAVKRASALNVFGSGGGIMSGLGLNRVVSGGGGSTTTGSGTSGAGKGDSEIPSSALAGGQPPALTPAPASAPAPRPGQGAALPTKVKDEDLWGDH